MESSTKKIIVLLSGGADSATVLAKAVQEVGSENVKCLNIYYGQRLDREMQGAKALAEYYKVELITKDISDIMLSCDCSLLKSSNKEIAHKTYKEQLQEKSRIDSYVPFRNGILISLATALADDMGFNSIYYGAHFDDYAYPDCSGEFIDAISNCTQQGTINKLTVSAPFRDTKKADIIKLGLSLGVPYQLTWSCYEGGEKPCCKCASCIDRINAFKVNGQIDPLIKGE